MEFTPNEAFVVSRGQDRERTGYGCQSGRNCHRSDPAGRSRTDGTDVDAGSAVRESSIIRGRVSPYTRHRECWCDHRYGVVEVRSPAGDSTLYRVTTVEQVIPETYSEQELFIDRRGRISLYSGTHWSPDHVPGIPVVVPDIGRIDPLVPEYGT